MEKFVNLRNVLVFFILFIFTGCASITIPSYIQDKNPYKRKMYSSFEKTVNTVARVLEETNWHIERQTDPAVFERSVDGEDLSKQETLFITKVREMGLFLGTRYAKMNVFVRAASENYTEVEIRYVTVNSTLVKNFHNYKHNKSVERLFLKIEEKLNKSE